MNYFAVILFSILVMPTISVADTTDVVYVDTSGHVIPESAVGEFCRPTEKLPNGTVMVFSKSAADLALYEERLLANGVTDYANRQEMVQAASNDECARKAGNSCASGTCPAGKTCKQTYTGGMTSCSCQ